MTEPDRPNRILLDDLRAEDADMDELVVTRLQRRLHASTGSGAVTQPLPRRNRWWTGAHAGLAAALLVGSALGAGGHALVSYVGQRSSAAPKGAAVTPPVSVPSADQRPEPPASAPRADEHDTPVVPTLSPQPVLPRPVPTVSEREPVGLEAELQALEAARRAMVERRADQALDALRSHRQRYPHSMLQQERDAMTVKALVASGRTAEARAAADAFERSYPNSLLLDSVKLAVASIQ